MSTFSSIVQVIDIWKGKPEAFSNQGLFQRAATNQSFYVRMRGGKQEPLALVLNPTGRFILVQIGNENYALPHPRVRMDETSIEDSGFGNFFDFQGNGRNADDYELVSLSKLNNEGTGKFTLVQKGVIRFK